MELYFTDARLKDEMAKCQHCEEKPCKRACPADCSPADFILAASGGMPSDYLRAATQILSANPLGEICGLVCPDSLCMNACVQKLHGDVLDIPKIQATILRKAREQGSITPLRPLNRDNKKVAVIGAGPSGLAASAYLVQMGHRVILFDSAKHAGGACRWIPESRLSKKALDSDIGYLLRLEGIQTFFGKSVDDPNTLLAEGYEAILITTGLSHLFSLNIPGTEHTVPYDQYLAHPDEYKNDGTVAVIGGGAVAVDAALIAKQNGAKRVEMFVLERLSEMSLDKDELLSIVDAGIDVSLRTRIVALRETEHGHLELETVKIHLKKEGPFSLDNLTNESESIQDRRGFDLIVTAIGAKKKELHTIHPAIFCAGDYDHGPSTVVEAAASGKNYAFQIDNFLKKTDSIPIRNPRKSSVTIPGYQSVPTDLKADFFGRPILSPFLLAAAPPSDGLRQMKLAYESGWPGGVMKTAFDNLPIHIPSEYMFVFDSSTYANCDNVSGHPLDRVCHEVETLVKEFPDRLTLASTGGPVTGHDKNDAKGWQNNTRKLEDAGVMGIEYSLSCPQGGDGTKGDIVSQDPELTAKIIGWILEKGDPNIPKLFKLTPAVTSIKLIMLAIEKALKKYPKAKAGVTLANSFPVLSFRPNKDKSWDEGIVVGMSGTGVMPISCLTLANVSGFKVPVSGNGGAMNYLDAAHFLALGAKTVQFCSLVLKHGYSIINELHSGLGYYLHHKGMSSVKDLIGVALPHPITGFGDLSPVKKVSDRNQDICVTCGNCTRCPYLAISLDEKGFPKTDPSACIGCGLCAQKCFSGALFMRERSKEETAALTEH